MRLPPLPFKVRPRGDSWAPGWCVAVEEDEYSVWLGVAHTKDATEPERWEDSRYAEILIGAEWVRP